MTTNAEKKDFCATWDGSLATWAEYVKRVRFQYDRAPYKKRQLLGAELASRLARHLSLTLELGWRTSSSPSTTPSWIIHGSGHRSFAKPIEGLKGFLRADRQKRNAPVSVSVEKSAPAKSSDHIPGSKTLVCYTGCNAIRQRRTPR